MEQFLQGASTVTTLAFMFWLTVAPLAVLDLLLTGKTHSHLDRAVQVFLWVFVLGTMYFIYWSVASLLRG